MSRLADAVTRAQQIALAATEECHRVGHAELDVDHLLVALTCVGGPAGSVLAGLGVGVDRARAAVAQVHADRLARAGVPVPTVAPRPLAAPSGAIPWAPRADRLLKGRWDTPSGDDRPILRALVTEPSGFVTEALTALGLDAPRVLAAADAWREPVAAPAAPTHAPDDRPWRTVTYRAWLPAAPTDVWALVVDPARRTAWDPWYARVEERPDGTLLADLRTEEDGGKQVRADLQRQVLTVVAREEGRLIEWELMRPDRADGRPLQRLAVALAPSGDGTCVDLAVRWLPRPGWRRLVGTLLRPVGRWAYRQMLMAKHAGISRTLR